MAFVYLAFLKDKTAFKIGRSKDPVERLISLSRFYDFDLSEVVLANCNSYDCSAKLESSMHFFCSGHRFRMEYQGGTEFFHFSVYRQVVSLLEESAKLQDYTVEKISVTENLSKRKPDADLIELELEKLAHSIKRRRIELNLNRRKMGTIVGVTRKTISRAEAGDPGLGIGTFLKMINVLGLEYELSDFRPDPNCRRKRAG